VKMQQSRVDLQGDYGFDSPYVPIGFAAAATACVVVAVILFELSWPWLSGLALACAVIFSLSTLSFVWTTKRGKFAVWAELLDALPLQGDKRLLDVGCGRGAVLMLAAKRLPRGRAVGLDLWSPTDQSGNNEQATLRNAEREGVENASSCTPGTCASCPSPTTASISSQAASPSTTSAK
jgi:arsenite methyltransferase